MNHFIDLFFVDTAAVQDFATLISNVRFCPNTPKYLPYLNNMPKQCF